jgi:hypothetical protein
MRLRRVSAFLIALSLLSAAHAAHAADVLVIPVAPTLDRPTIVSLGVQILITAGDDHDASITVRYRPAGAST